MNTTETQVTPGGEERLCLQTGVTAERSLRPPADFVHENGQIMLELLRRRAAEQERLFFVEGLRRLDRHARVTEES